MKADNTNKKLKAKKNKRTLVYEDKEWYSFKEREMPESYALSVARQMYDWALTEKAIKINDFLRKKKIYRSTIKVWRDKFAEFDAIYKECLLIIGDRREEHAFFKRGDATIFLKSANVYDDEWRDIDHYQKELKSDEEDKERPIHIYLGEVPKSDLVEKALKRSKDDSQKI